MTATTMARPAGEHDGGVRSPRARRRATGALVGIATVALLVDLWVRTPMAGVAALAAVVALVVTLLGTGAVHGRWARACVVAAVLPALFLPLRAAGWLIAVDLAAVVALLALGAALGPDGDPFDADLGQLVRWSARLGGATATAPATVVAAVGVATPAPSDEGRARMAAVARGLALGVPVAGVVGLLLAAGDAVFASFFSWSVDLGGTLGHAAVIVAGAWAAAAVIGLALRPSPTPSERAPAAVGPVEGVVVLGGLVAVYALYAVARLLVVARGDAYVQQATGLTYAEYARSGFFQLLWAAALTLGVLLAVRRRVRTPTTGWRRAVVGLSLAAVALTLVMVHGAVVRLDLYEAAYGATVLRWTSTVVAGWVGLAFVLTGAALAGALRDRRWLAGAMGVAALTTLLVVNVADPEASVMAANVARAERTGELDLPYALGLSDDAVPALASAVPTIDDPWERRRATVALCSRRGGGDEWNRAVRRAEAALGDLCG